MKQASVVVLNYNGIQFIGDCLESLMHLEEQELFDVIVVDNGSTDKSREFIEERYPQIRLIVLKENTGFCHGVNEGIAASHTPYVILLNNDTLVLPGFVKALVDAMENNPKAFAIGAQMLDRGNPELIDDAGDRYCVLGWAYARGKGRDAGKYDRFAKVFAACGGAAVYRREIMDKIGTFDENHFAYLEDTDICYRARINGYYSYYEPAAKVLHSGSASSGSRYNSFKTSLTSANSVYLIGKNMPILQIILNSPFLLAGFIIKAFFYASKGMGRLYLCGLLRGVRMMFSEEGRAHRVKFHFRNLGHYLGIQGLLYLDTLRRPGKW